PGSYEGAMASRWNENYAQGLMPWDAGVPDPMLIQVVEPSGCSAGPRVAVVRKQCKVEFRHAVQGAILCWYCQWFDHSDFSTLEASAGCDWQSISSALRRSGGTLGRESRRALDHRARCPTRRVRQPGRPVIRTREVPRRNALLH